MIFDDVLKIINGRNQKAVENPNGKYPIYGSGGIMGRADDYICNAETVVIGRKGNINKPIFVEEPFWNVDTAFGLEANKSVLLPKYLFYFCVHYDFEKHNKTVTIPSLTKADLLKIKIDLPSLGEQQDIVKKLQQIETIIFKRKQELDILDELIKARFVEMFGDPVRNEKNWPIATIGDVAEIKIGPFGTLLHKEDYIEGGHALVNPSHIIDGKICIDSKLTVSDEKYNALLPYQLQPGDVVLGRRGEMGRCAVVYQEGLLCGTGSMILRPNEKMKPYFLQNIISSPTYRKTIEDKAVGVTMPNLNVPIVSSLKIPLLPIAEQDYFIELMHQVDKSKVAVQRALNETQLLFDSLMQRYFG
jgi:type I restriction enzyme S subunit